MNRAKILLAKIITTFYRRVVVFSREMDGPWPRMCPLLPVAISLLRESDLQEYLRFRPEQNSAMIRRRLAGGDGCILVRLSGRIVHSGWVATKKKFDPYLRCLFILQPGEIFLYDHYTEPSYRGRGLSTARELYILQRYPAEGYHRSVAIVAVENKPAFRPFQAAGYRPIGMFRCLWWVLGNKIWQKSYGGDPLPHILQSRDQRP